MDETECIDLLIKNATLPQESIEHIQSIARELVTKVRQSRLKKGGLDAFLYEYDLSSEEGIALMCLAEALLRIPDSKTRDRLIKDKIVDKNWEKHVGKSHSWFVNAGTLGLMLTGKMLSPADVSTQKLMTAFKRLTNRLSEPVMRQALTQGMKILGRQFVMGETIELALERAKAKEAQGYRYSYDMLGEAAKTAEDAASYFKDYQTAIKKIGEASNRLGPMLGPGVSVKLSALHPRYEWANRERMMNELLPKLKNLCLQAKEVNIGLTIDAEETDRLELSLLLIESLSLDQDLGDWQGLGLAVQAYQKRAFFVIDWLADLAKRSHRKLMLRLVKGAYWDSEIKWTQEKGLKSYPVFTRKSSTDLCYQACIYKILNYGELFYPQFATHNAYSLASVLEMTNTFLTKSFNEKFTENSNANDREKNILHFEFQCLHGMGDSLYDNIVGEKNYNIPCRIYAPVGGHEHLLAYLVRRLLENGANTSFVNRIIDENTPIDELLQDPVAKTAALQSKPHPKIPLPRYMYLPDRLNSKGIDLTNELEINPLLKQVKEIIPDLFVKPIESLTGSQLDEMLEIAARNFNSWNNTSPSVRANHLEKMADLIEDHYPKLMALLIREGVKTVQDAISEIREAADFCRYYANRCQIDFIPQHLPGPTGEYNQLELQGRGVIACISPWNFPLAIFLGQITGALAAGNTVIAKPASQTPYVAQFAVSLLHQAGFPKEVVQIAIGRGATIGERLIEDGRVMGIMFTGSTETAAGINLAIAKRPGPIIPFIAETGGQNVMIVDSSALPEQVVSDVLTSAFNSAGQRCSALRVLFLQDEIADRIINMLVGAMQELKIGDPLLLDTDVGPVIDKKASEGLTEHTFRMEKEAKLLYQCSIPISSTSSIPDISSLPELPRGVFFAPRAYEIDTIEQLKHEVFGPILHVIRYSLDDLDTILDSINNIGYGLTLGIHSRINETAEFIYNRLKIGNIYVNRNMIGAVVGVQPFGGQGLSGTGPKAGGPHMLPRLSVERTLSVNIAAAGGNMALMSLSEEQ